MNTVRRTPMAWYAAHRAAAPRNSKKQPVRRNSRSRQSPANCRSSRHMIPRPTAILPGPPCTEPEQHVLVCSRNRNDPLLRVDLRHQVDFGRFRASRGHHLPDGLKFLRNAVQQQFLATKGVFHRCPSQQLVAMLISSREKPPAVVSS